MSIQGLFNSTSEIIIIKYKFQEWFSCFLSKRLEFFPCLQLIIKAYKEWSSRLDTSAWRLWGVILVPQWSLAQLPLSRQGRTTLQTSLAIHFHRYWTFLFLIKRNDFFSPPPATSSCLNSYDDTLQSCHYISGISINHTLLDTIIE